MKFLRTSSSEFFIIEMISASIAFIFVWNSRHSTPSPMSMRLAPAFDLMTFFLSLSEGRRTISGLSSMRG
jgi:hypothetical protein